MLANLLVILSEYVQTNNTTPHRRYNPLTGEWVLVSPHRATRPWTGKQESISPAVLPKYDPNCYLCPGNTRVSGKVNDQYTDAYVFENDHQAILPNGSDYDSDDNQLFRSQSIRGTCRVMCFSPRHDLTLSRMEEPHIVQVINEWIRQTNELKETYSWVQIFENKGEVMGCSNPHPHCQIWASNRLPTHMEKEDSYQFTYYKQNERSLLHDYLLQEQQKKERIVLENECWTVLVPYWATWPYETMLLPKRHILRITSLTEEEKITLASIMKQLLTIYDRLFNISFPYSMGWHGAPFHTNGECHWQLHAHYYPPLLRSATIKKFMVGYEMLAEAQRDITPEQAANRLAQLSTKK